MYEIFQLEDENDAAVVEAGEKWGHAQETIIVWQIQWWILSIPMHRYRSSWHKK